MPLVAYKDPTIPAKEDSTLLKRNLNINIKGKGKKGKITIDYYNLDDLDRLIAIFGA